MAGKGTAAQWEAEAAAEGVASMEEMRAAPTAVPSADWVERTAVGDSSEEMQGLAARAELPEGMVAMEGVEKPRSPT